MGAVARVSQGMPFPWCMYDNVGTSIPYIIQREGDGKEPMTKTRLTPRSYSPVALQARLRSRQVTRKKTGENRRRFSTTTGIKDNPIRLELILGELHFSSAKYSVITRPRQPVFPSPLLLSSILVRC